jgi:circadian clock protein KaiC
MSGADVSSITDTWILLRDRNDGIRSRSLLVLKSRGMAHSNQIREFLITSHGIDLVEPYIGPEGVLTGTARAAQEVRERLLVDAQRAEDERQARLIERKRDLLRQKIGALEAEFAAEELELQKLLSASSATNVAWSDERARASLARGAIPGGESNSAGTAPFEGGPRKRNGSTSQGRSAAKG